MLAESLEGKGEEAREHINQRPKSIGMKYANAADDWKKISVSTRKNATKTEKDLILGDFRFARFGRLATCRECLASPMLAQGQER